MAKNERNFTSAMTDALEDQRRLQAQAEREQQQLDQRKPAASVRNPAKVNNGEGKPVPVKDRSHDVTPMYKEGVRRSYHIYPELVEAFAICAAQKGVDKNALMNEILREGLIARGMIAEAQSGAVE